MATKVLMPKVSDAMQEGRVVRWAKREGEPVESGDVLAEIETDKANLEMEAFGSGLLRKILTPEGEVAPVGGMIAVIGEAEEDISELLAEATAPKAAAPAPPPRPAGPPPGPAAEARPAGPPAEAREDRLKASPVARKLAKREGIGLEAVPGSGPGGRIIKRDLEAAVQRMAARPRPAAAPAGPEYEDRPLSSMRRAIAARLVQSKGPVPHFYVTGEVAMDAATELRAAINGLEAGVRVSLNDLVLRACAVTLPAHPGVNAAFLGDAIRFHHRVHLGLAVAVEDGLITPVIRDADQKSLAQLAEEARALAAQARERKLLPAAYTGATFTVSNLGMFDVVEFSAVINPPEGAILAVGAVRQVAAVVGDAVRVARRMQLTLSCDHRVVDGATAARFLRDLRQVLERPLLLLL